MESTRHAFDQGFGASEKRDVTARVLLGDELVGYLAPVGNVVAFTFDAGYLARPDRPVLGQAFEDRELSADQPIAGSASMPLPAFFRNALPEGALRKVVEARLQRSRLIELDMLLRLGPDLPGALRVLADPLDAEVDEMDGENAHPPSRRGMADPSDPIRFSLSGVQLKASVQVDLDDASKITLPLVGEGGRWIAKFPSASYRKLPENEHTMLTWARMVGLNVPNHRLVDVASIQNLPVEFPREGRALLVERFDRPESGVRVHQEDLAQVFELQPEEKELLFVPEVTVTYAGMGAVVTAIAGEIDFTEFTRRVAFMILSGNADAHAKNWSLIYPDRVHACLSPLYDVVSTVAYPSLDRTLPLAFVEAREPTSMTRIAIEAITYRDIRELAEWAGESADAVESDIRSFAEQARRAWREVRGEAPSFVTEAVDRHLGQIAL
jgi:serine/threonine-protein kinase HipA